MSLWGTIKRDGKQTTAAYQYLKTSRTIMLQPLPLQMLWERTRWGLFDAGYCDSNLNMLDDFHIQHIQRYCLLKYVAGNVWKLKFWILSAHFVHFCVHFIKLTFSLRWEKTRQRSLRWKLIGLPEVKGNDVGCRSSLVVASSKVKHQSSDIKLSCVL